MDVWNVSTKPGEAHSGGALTWQEGWTFDALHRLTSRTTTKSTDTGVETRAEQFTFSGLHQPRCATPGSCEEERTKYDGAGRVTHLTSPTGDARTLQWTHDSMLRSVTEVGGGVLQENGYALAGERTTRSGAYGTYRYLGPTVTDGPTGLNAHVWVNGSRVATAFPAGTYFYVGDQLGSTTMVLDSGGDVVTQVVQSPYGREIYQSAAPDWAPPAQQFLLTGKERDPETGFHAYGWRDWSSAGNHWLAPEPIWEDALKQGAVALNLYQGMSWRGPAFIDADGRASKSAVRTFKSPEAAAYAGLLEARKMWTPKNNKETGVLIIQKKGRQEYAFVGPMVSNEKDPENSINLGPLLKAIPKGWRLRGDAHDHSGYRGVQSDERFSKEDRENTRSLRAQMKDDGPYDSWLGTPRGQLRGVGDSYGVEEQLPYGFEPKPGAPPAFSEYIPGAPLPTTPPQGFLDPPGKDSTPRAIKTPSAEGTP